jgi:aminoglycoside phosphotransferase (APT) family kinase protein
MSALADGLARWLGERWGTTVTVAGLDQSSAGARRTNIGFDATADGVTRRLAATILPTADIQLIDLGAEAEVRTLAQANGVITPFIHGACLDPSVIGGPFFVSDFVTGESVPRRVLRLVEQAGNGAHIAAQIADALARLHAIDPALAPAGLPRPADGVGPIAAALGGVRDSIGLLLQPEPALLYGLRWLEANRPDEPARRTIVHSDVRTGNVIVGPDGLRAILDWETAKVGDPMEDLAWPCLRMWRFRNDHLLVGGISGIEPYRDAYLAAGGAWDQDRFEWWRVLGTLRWGLGLANQAAQHLDGRFRTIVMAASGRRVSELAWDLLCLITPPGGRID